jgi:ketosteroid isomerase-like protein
VERSGDLGYLLSTVVLELPPADGQATIGFNDVTVWRRDAEQGWRIVVDSANREPAG